MPQTKELPLGLSSDSQWSSKLDAEGHFNGWKHLKSVTKAYQTASRGRVYRTDLCQFCESGVDLFMFSVYNTDKLVPSNSQSD